MQIRVLNNMNAHAEPFPPIFLFLFLWFPFYSFSSLGTVVVGLGLICLAEVLSQFLRVQCTTTIRGNTCSMQKSGLGFSICGEATFASLCDPVLIISI